MSDQLPVPAPEPYGEVLLYQADDGTARIEVRLEGDTVWLPQRVMAGLFQTTRQNVSLPIQHIFEEEELRPEATVRQYLTVQTEGNRQIQRPVDHYSLDVIIAVGYRVNPPRHAVPHLGYRAAARVSRQGMHDGRRPAQTSRRRKLLRGTPRPQPRLSVVALVVGLVN
jgi:hypothetical protein